jgi:pimeloyl-ACP methyl ester carboxylesterase
VARVSTLYLDIAGETVSAIVEEPAASRQRDTAVLMSPPFGWHDVASYRIRRRWALDLANRGYTTMRVSLPSTGDSGGSPSGPGRVDAWIGTIADAARWLRDRPGLDRVAVVGLGLGGMMALAAVARGAPVQQLVLWASPGRGRTLLRELRALSRIEAAEFTSGDPPEVPPGELQVGGFLLTAETVAGLEAFDVARLSLADGPLRRVLLLERDGIAPEKSLREAIGAAGVDLTVALGDGYGAMTSNPQQARVPGEVFDRVGAWLDDGSGSVSPTPPRLADDGRAHATIRLSDGSSVRERPLIFAQPFGEAIGILTEPAEAGEPEHCIVMLNAGAIRRIGPGRMWVEIARRWAARGVPVLRLDLEGIGDADGDSSPYVQDGALYATRFVDQTLAVLDVLEEAGIGGRFLLGGLCSGAYWSYHAALRDERVVAVGLLNAQALFWKDSMTPSRDIKRMIVRREWHKIRGVHPSRYWAVLRWIVTAPFRWLVGAVGHPLGRRPSDEIDRSLDSLRDAGKPVLLLFSEDEPLHRDLTGSGHIERLARWPNVTLELVHGRDHPLRPLFSQREVHDAFDRWLRPIVAPEGALVARDAAPHASD